MRRARDGRHRQRYAGLVPYRAALLCSLSYIFELSSDTRCGEKSPEPGSDAMLWGAAQQAGVRDLLTGDCRMALNWRDVDLSKQVTIG
jgi:hypothetical protein